MPGLSKIKYAHKGYFPKADEVNEKILAGVERYSEDPLIHKTHYFEGRYENIYIDREKIPGMDRVIEQAEAYAAEILDIDIEQLQCGFWFNLMQKGDVTIAHTHDDDDELLSAVYYVAVPDQSAKLCLGVGDNQEIVAPEAGMMVFFSPQLVHEVTTNLSDLPRLSIGMNFGRRKDINK